MDPVQIDPSWVKICPSFSFVPGRMIVRAYITAQAFDYCEEAEIEDFIEVMRQRLIDTLSKPENSDEL